jgi:3-oxoacyl-[acyl-carrier protein] reductase
MDLKLRGKVALVTGGSRGIGRGIALELAKEGCELFICGRDQTQLGAVAAEITELGGKAYIVAADLLKEDAAAQIAAAVQKATGRVDILVNNAGAARRGDFLKTANREWHEGFAVKFFGAVWLSRALWPMLKTARGSVVFISGIGARAPVADYMIGASVIGASLAFMKALAELGKADGVQVLTVNPGSVDTARFRQRLAVIMQATGLDEAAAIERHRRDLDITRFGTPEDIAHLVAFAVSPKGRWIHGTAIDIDGGQVDPLRMSRYDAANRANDPPAGR